MGENVLAKGPEVNLPWLSRSDVGARHSPSYQDLDCQVLVIGSGIGGALVAHHLTQAGQACVVLDRSHPGDGMTRTSTTLLPHDPKVPLCHLAERIGLAEAIRAYQMGGEAINALETICQAFPESGFQRRPSIYFTCQEEECSFLQEECQMRARAGLDVRWLNAGELRDGWGIQAAGAIFSPSATLADPGSLAQALIQHCVDRGARLYPHTTIRQIDAEDRHVRVTTDKGFIRAQWVVMTTGIDAIRWLPRSVVRFVSTYALVTEPLPRAHVWPDRAMLWEHASQDLSVRWTADHRLLLDGADEPFEDLAERDQRIPEKTLQLMTRIGQVLPAMPLEPAFAWANLAGSTANGLGYVGAVAGQPRVLFSLGFGGNGITCSEIAARMISETVCGRSHPDASLLAFDRIESST